MPEMWGANDSILYTFVANGAIDSRSVASKNSDGRIRSLLNLIGGVYKIAVDY